MTTEYFILDLPARGDMLLWWRPKASGYTTRIESAGRYTEEQVRAQPDYYDNGKTAMAVPTHAVAPLVVTVVPNASSSVEMFKMLRPSLGTPFDTKVHPVSPER